MTHRPSDATPCPRCAVVEPVFAALAALLPVERPTGGPSVLSMEEAAVAVGLSYSTFRKTRAYRLANVAPASAHPRFDRARLLRIAENLRKTG